MPDRGKKFHQFALQSILFKGRNDWYFCFLKAERIAHVLAVIAQQSPTSVGPSLEEMARRAGELPQTIAHCAANEVDAPVVLADVFSLLTTVRLAGTAGTMAETNARVIAEEYENLAERFAGSLHPSPFASAEDFTIPPFGGLGALGAGPERLAEAATPFETSKSALERQGQTLDPEKPVAKGRKDRLTTILDFVRKNKRVSIKDITAVVRGCSEKTIQRELARLIRQGLVTRVGERRWSVYLPVPSSS